MIGNVGFAQQCSKSLIGMHKGKPSIAERLCASAGAFASSHLVASPPFFQAELRVSKPQKAAPTRGWQRWIRMAVLQITHWDLQSQAKHFRAASRVCRSLCFKPLGCFPPFFQPSPEPRSPKKQHWLMVGNAGFVRQCSKSLIGTCKVKPSIAERLRACAGVFASSHLAASPLFQPSQDSA